MAVKIEKLTSEELKNRPMRKGPAGENETVVSAVKSIIADVIDRKDAAVAEYTAKFDDAALAPEDFRVGPDEIAAAAADVDGEIVEAMRLAAARIRRFHGRQLPESWEMEGEGTVLGQRVTPISRVGLYVPGGRASYPSSVLMNAIPAVIAGVDEIALCVPPDSAGRVNPYVLAAASIAGVDEIYRIGGAQAIAAMAYGTETIPAVDKIAGPGNIYVATAKRLVIGQVDIDMIAGPTEVVVIADGRAPAPFIAADMIAQAEHDPEASAILLTDDSDLAGAVNAALDEQARSSPREKIVREALEKNGAIYVVEDLGAAVDFANRYAPEHLEIMTARPEELLPKIRNAGAIFLGDYTPEAVGDYIAGANHVLPTASTARFYSPLGVYDFIKWSSVLSFGKEALKKIGPAAVSLAEIEGLAGHAGSVRIRLESIADSGDEGSGS